MLGKRIYKQNPDDYPQNPGEYMKGENGRWELCLPSGIHGAINDKIWKIEEHEDGTISVTPSILTKCHVDSYSWHGYLKKGIWEECK